MANFDSKVFNPQAFGAYVKRIPNTKKNELAKCGAIGTNEQAKTALSGQTGSLYVRVPYLSVKIITVMKSFWYLGVF